MFAYENLIVYKKAFETNQKVYRILKGNKAIVSYAKNQLGRASLSIMLNIAEGSAKLSKKDRINFFATARGSAFECSSLVTFLFEEQEILCELKEELYASYEEISKMLFTMIRNLQG
jgi:four helix bundle protein